MFGRRRRNGFDGDGLIPDDNGFNGMTGYEEKTVFPADFGKTVEPAAQTATAVRDGFSATSTTAERPMVFVSKENSGVFIYEYADRLEYYVKLESSMFMFNVVKKN